MGDEKKGEPLNQKRLLSNIAFVAGLAALIVGLFLQATGGSISAGEVSPSLLVWGGVLFMIAGFAADRIL